MIPLWMWILAAVVIVGAVALGIKSEHDLKRIEEKYGGNDNEGYETNPN